MIGNNFKIAVRQLLKNKLFSFINIIGLSLGLAVCIVVAPVSYTHLDVYKRQAVAFAGAEDLPLFNKVIGEARTLEIDRVVRFDGSVPWWRRPDRP